MRLCLIGGVVILLVVIIGIPSNLGRVLTGSSPDCGQEGLGHGFYVHFLD